MPVFISLCCAHKSVYSKSSSPILLHSARSLWFLNAMCGRRQSPILNIQLLLKLPHMEKKMREAVRDFVEKCLNHYFKKKRKKKKIWKTFFLLLKLLSSNTTCVGGNIAILRIDQRKFS